MAKVTLAKIKSKTAFIEKSPHTHHEHNVRATFGAFFMND